MVYRGPESALQFFSRFHPILPKEIYSQIGLGSRIRDYGLQRDDQCEVLFNGKTSLIPVSLRVLFHLLYLPKKGRTGPGVHPVSTSRRVSGSTTHASDDSPDEPADSEKLAAATENKPAAVTRRKPAAPESKPVVAENPLLNLLRLKKLSASPVPPRPSGLQKTFSGLQYEVLKYGNGRRPTSYNQVRVHYHGYLPDGSVFDSSVDRGQPATFPLNRVIAGWKEALP